MACVELLRSLTAWAVVLPWVAWALMRLLGLERGYPVVPLAAFTPYAALAAVTAVAVALVLGRRGAAAVAVLAALVMLWGVAPRALADRPADAAGGPRLRVLSTNVLRGQVDPASLVALVRRERVDVLSVQELTPAMARGLEDAGLHETLPERVLRPSSGAKGTGLYARVDLSARAGPEPSQLDIAAARADAAGTPVDLVAVHPPPPTRRWIDIWKRDLRALPPAPRSGPVRILAGDFNATLDHAEMRRLLDTGYLDAAAAAGSGLAPTWPAGRRFPPVTIDHVLADARCRVLSARVLDLPGTDHRPVLAELALPPG